MLLFHAACPVLYNNVRMSLRGVDCFGNVLPSGPSPLSRATREYTPSAGYRIGPGPIEDWLLRHPAVRAAAVVGARDAGRTEIVCAFVVLKDGFAPGDTLVRERQAHVRTALAHTNIRAKYCLSPRCR